MCPLCRLKEKRPSILLLHFETPAKKKYEFEILLRMKTVAYVRNSETRKYYIKIH